MLIELDEKDFGEIFALLEEGFPPSERRTERDQKKLLDMEAYTVYGLKEDGELIGIVAEWEGPAYRFVEHFVVSAASRGHGTGSKLLREYTEMSGKPVILEVEPPDGDTEKRRVKFYERNGYHLTEFGYVQPTINEEIKGVPLVIMSYPDMLEEQEFSSIKNWLFRTVYDKEKMIK